MRRKFALPRLLTALALILSACEVAKEPSQPAATRRATFTPLVVKTAIPVPTPTPRPELEAATATGATLPATETDPTTKALHFILVQHARCAWDASWCPVEKGILDAAREMNVTITLLGPDSPDLQQTAALIDQAVAAQPDGIALTVSDPLALRQAILFAIDSGIPVLAYHDGSGPIQDDLPYLTYLGMDNYQGGYLGGQRLIQAGAQAGVCLNTSLDLAIYQTRCKGFLSAFQQAGLQAETLDLSQDPARAQDDIQHYVQAHDQVNAFLTADPDSTRVLYAWLETADRAGGKILHGAFDLDEIIRVHIESGVTLFGIDPQPYLQGYEAVFWLTMIARFGFKPATPVIATGPHFVDKASLHTQVDPDKPLYLIFVQHALCAWDTYWCVVERGIRDAARERGVQADIRGPGTFDLDRMAAQIDEAAASHPDGMGVTVPDPVSLHASILRAIQAGFPVVAYDTGSGPVEDNLPYLTFIGTNSEVEYQGGYLAALRLIHAGGSTGVCVNHQFGHVALGARCRGMIDAFAKEGLTAEELDSSGDPQQAYTILSAFAREHPEVNVYLTMGGGDPGAVTFYRYLETANRPRGEVLHGTFDLSPQVVTAIEDGTTLFAVDGQPYLMVYSAVMILTLGLRQDVWPAAPITPTGPGFVDLSNIAIVKQLAGKYR
jgi:simple sugar transport system substrate-binding protein